MTKRYTHKKSHIEFIGNNFTIRGQTSVIPPKSKTPANSYYQFGRDFHYMTAFYDERMKYFIEKQNDSIKALKKSKSPKNKIEFKKAHFSVTREIYCLQTYYSNACLATELMLKALIINDMKIEKLDEATKIMKKYYGHNLKKLYMQSIKMLDLSQKETKLLDDLNIMYGGIKRFQYPHEYVQNNVIPPYETVIVFNKKLLKKVGNLIEKNV